MDDLITSMSQITVELQDIQNFIEETMSEDPNEAVLRGNDLSVYMARTGKLLADAKFHRDKKLRSEIVSQIKEMVKLPPSVATKFTDTLVERESYLMNWAERSNRSCTHQLEWCRTIISKAKAEMNAFNG